MKSTLILHPTLGMIVAAIELKGVVNYIIVNKTVIFSLTQSVAEIIN